MMNSIATISDIHGCFEEFKELYAKILEAGINKDSIFLVGDLLDKGDQGPECITFARENNIKSVSGNHEYKYARWFKHVEKKKANPSYVIPMKMNDHELDQASRLSPEDVLWIQSLPAYYKFKHWIIVHAGMFPGIPVEKQPVDKLMVIRHLTEDNKVFEVNYKDIGKSLPPGVVDWFTKYDGKYNVIFGHQIVSMKKPKVFYAPSGAMCVGIDLGCSAGGYLAAAIVNTDDAETPPTFLQVKARRVYKPLYAPIIEDE